MNTLIGIWIFVLGLCVGSFLNVAIIRGMKGEQIVSGRSHCTTCDYELTWRDNIPLVSYIMLKGKCRNCGQHISLQYPVVEALNALCWVLIFVCRGLTMTSVLYMVASSCMIALSVVDLKIQEIPMVYNEIILLCGFLNMIHTKDFKSAIIGMLCVPVFLMLVALITRGRGIGFGDVKFEIAAGFLLGWKFAILSFYIGCVALVISYVILHKVKVKGFEGRQVPFGPALSLGAFVMMLAGEPISQAVFSWLTGGI